MDLGDIGEATGYPQGTTLRVVHVEEPPFDQRLLDGLIAICNRNSTWELGETRGDFCIWPHYGALNYKDRAFAMPTDNPLGGVAFREVVDVYATLPGGCELDPDSYWDVPPWYDKLALFLQQHGWHLAENAGILDGEETDVWFPPETVCNTCPAVLACKTKRLT